MNIIVKVSIPNYIYNIHRLPSIMNIAKHIIRLDWSLRVTAPHLFLISPTAYFLPQQNKRNFIDLVCLQPI